MDNPSIPSHKATRPGPSGRHATRRIYYRKQLRDSTSAVARVHGNRPRLASAVDDLAGAPTVPPGQLDKSAASRPERDAHACAPAAAQLSTKLLEKPCPHCNLTMMTILTDKTLSRDNARVAFHQHVKSCPAAMRPAPPHYTAAAAGPATDAAPRRVFYFGEYRDLEAAAAQVPQAFHVVINRPSTEEWVSWPVEVPIPWEYYFEDMQALELQCARYGFGNEATQAGEDARAAFVEDAREQYAAYRTALRKARTNAARTAALKRLHPGELITVGEQQRRAAVAAADAEAAALQRTRRNVRSALKHAIIAAIAQSRGETDVGVYSMPVGVREQTRVRGDLERRFGEHGGAALARVCVEFAEGVSVFDLPGSAFHHSDSVRWGARPSVSARITVGADSLAPSFTRYQPIGVVPDGLLAPHEAAVEAKRRYAVCKVRAYAPEPELSEDDDDWVHPDVTVRIAGDVSGEYVVPAKSRVRELPLDLSDYALTLDGKPLLPGKRWIDYGVTTTAVVRAVGRVVGGGVHPTVSVNGKQIPDPMWPPAPPEGLLLKPDGTWMELDELLAHEHCPTQALLSLDCKRIIRDAVSLKARPTRASTKEAVAAWLVGTPQPRIVEWVELYYVVRAREQQRNELMYTALDVESARDHGRYAEVLARLRLAWRDWKSVNVGLEMLRAPLRTAAVAGSVCAAAAAVAKRNDIALHARPALAIAALATVGAAARAYRSAKPRALPCITPEGLQKTFEPHASTAKPTAAAPAGMLGRVVRSIAPRPRAAKLRVLHAADWKPGMSLVDCTSATICGRQMEPGSFGETDEEMLEYGRCIIDPTHKLTSVTGLTVNRGCRKGDEDGLGIATGPVLSRVSIARLCACSAWIALLRRHATRMPPCAAKSLEVPRHFTLAMQAAYAVVAASEILSWLTVRAVDLNDAAEIKRLCSEMGLTEVQLRSRACDRGRNVVWETKWTLQKAITLADGMLGRDADDGRVKAMVKAEVGKTHNDPMDVASVIMKARLIQMYANPATQCRSGPLAQSMMAALKEVWCGSGKDDPLRMYDVSGARGGSIRVSATCGRSNTEIGELMTQIAAAGYTGALELDGKRFDSTVNKVLHDAAGAVYRKVCPEWADLYEEARCVKGYYKVRGSDAGFAYELAETTKSGHSDTTLTNTLINGLVMSRVASEMGLSCWILVAGDDSLVCVRPQDATWDIFREFASRVAAYGLLPEGAPFAKVEQASFISGMFLPVQKERTVRYIFVPQVFKMMSKIFWSIKPPQPDKQPGWRRRGLEYAGHRSAVAACVLHALRNLRPVRAFFQPMADAAAPSDVATVDSYGLTHVHHGAATGEAYDAETEAALDRALCERYVVDAVSLNVICNDLARAGAVGSPHYVKASSELLHCMELDSGVEARCELYWKCGLDGPRGDDCDPASGWADASEGAECALTLPAVIETPTHVDCVPVTYAPDTFPLLHSVVEVDAVPGSGEHNSVEDKDGERTRNTHRESETPVGQPRLERARAGLGDESPVPARAGGSCACTRRVVHAERYRRIPHLHAAGSAVDAARWGDLGHGDRVATWRQYRSHCVQGASRDELLHAGLLRPDDTAAPIAWNRFNRWKDRSRRVDGDLAGSGQLVRPCAHASVSNVCKEPDVALYVERSGQRRDADGSPAAGGVDARAGRSRDRGPGRRAATVTDSARTVQRVHSAKRGRHDKDGAGDGELGSEGGRVPAAPARTGRGGDVPKNGDCGKDVNGGVGSVGDNRVVRREPKRGDRGDGSGVGVPGRDGGEQRVVGVDKQRTVAGGGLPGVAVRGRQRVRPNVDGNSATKGPVEKGVVHADGQARGAKDRGTNVRARTGGEASGRAGRKGAPSVLCDSAVNGLCVPGKVQRAGRSAPAGGQRAARGGAAAPLAGAAAAASDAAKAAAPALSSCKGEGKAEAKALSDAEYLASISRSAKKAGSPGTAPKKVTSTPKAAPAAPPPGGAASTKQSAKPARPADAAAAQAVSPTQSEQPPPPAAPAVPTKPPDAKPTYAQVASSSWMGNDAAAWHALEGTPGFR